MDENDRTAIHEVMEQQTIYRQGWDHDLTNARVSIPGSQQPAYGRYILSKSCRGKCPAPAALLPGSTSTG